MFFAALHTTCSVFWNRSAKYIGCASFHRGPIGGSLHRLGDALELQDINQLIEAGAIWPVIDKVFRFDATNEALAYVKAGDAKGKVVIKVK